MQNKNNNFVSIITIFLLYLYLISGVNYDLLDTVYAINSQRRHISILKNVVNRTVNLMRFHYVLYIIMFY